MTELEKENLFEDVQQKLDTIHHRKCFVDDYFAEFDIPCDNATEFTQWFLDNRMGGSLMAHMNSYYGSNLYLTYDV